MKIVGTSYPVHDVLGKVTGHQQYAGDMQLSGMLHVAVLFSPIPHGKIKAIDASKALAREGVVAVLHCFNTTDRTFNRYRTTADQKLPEQERVFNDEVRFVGDRVAAVVAASPELARKALRLLEVEYEELPYATTTAEALQGKIDGMHPEGVVYGDFELEIGDRDKVAAETVSITTESSFDRISHLTMEPHACIADCDLAGNLTIYSPNQTVHGIRTVVGDLLEIPYHKIRVVKTTMGGSFGGKQEWMLEPVVAAIALQLKRPVSLVYNRAEAMISTISRSPIEGRLTTCFTADGLLQSVDLDVTLDAGAYLGNSYDYACVIGNKLFRCYRYPYAHYTTRAVCTNSPVSGAFRGWTSPELAIMLEHNLNQAALKLGMDPLELRLKNVVVPGDIDPRLQEPLGEVRAVECLTLGREKFAWQQKRDDDAAFNASQTRYRRGVGVGCGGHLNGYYPRKQDFATVGLRLNEDGTVLADLSLHDHGCGTVTAMQMILAETLDIAPERIYVPEADSTTTPFDMGCFSSRTTYVIGRAAQESALQLLEQMYANTAELYGLEAGDLYTENSHIKSKKDASFDLSWAELVCKSHSTLQRELRVCYQHVNTSNPGVVGAHFAHVEVDTYTGMTRILDYLAVHDIGQAINREICVAQIQGAVLMGSGAALSEHIVTDARGQHTDSLKNYHLINAWEAPEVQVELIEDGQTGGPYGAKSIGEVAHVPVAPTVAAAVNQALDSNLSQLPLYPDRILAYLKQRRDGQ